GTRAGCTSRPTSTPTTWSAASRSGSERRRRLTMYDLLLKGGTVIDPAQDLRGALDVAVEDGKIARVAANIPKSEARRGIDVPGKTLTPGLIDPHTHGFHRVAPNGGHPHHPGVPPRATRRRHHGGRRG